METYFVRMRISLKVAVTGMIAVFLGGLTVCADADEYVKDAGTTWTLGTKTVERQVTLENGKLLLTHFKDKSSGQELIADGAASPEFSFSIDTPENRITSASEGWTLAGTHESKGTQGERYFDIRLQRQSLEVTKSYAIYPDSSIIREWVTVKNLGNAPVRLIDPSFLNLSASIGAPDASDFLWMTGGDNQPGSWDLKTEKLSPDKARTFDSYDPFPFDTSKASYPGDGIDAKILKNDKPVWPDSGWKYVANAATTEAFDLSLDVKAGDLLAFLVDMHGNIGFDTTAFDPTILFDDGETHIASKEFSGEQGKNGWRYQCLEQGKYVDLVYYPSIQQWQKLTTNATGTPFIGQGNQHPDVGQNAARVWTAPKSGHVRITGTVRNSGNGQAPGKYGVRPTTGTYAPWYGLLNHKTHQGMFIGWDYFGHWASSFRLGSGGVVSSELGVAGFNQTLAPGESVTTPKAFVGLFRDDLDNAGNECLDWQYRYLWDYTREEWFPAIRMLGYWMYGTGWGRPGVGWTGGNPDLDSTFRKVFRVADLMQYVGADVYHRDWGWWDRAGDWNGPDFRTTINYLRKRGMGQLIYAFLYTVDPESKVAKEHPDWLIGGCLDMSKPEVVAFMKGQLDEFVERWGNFEWRNDSFFTAQRDGADTVMLAQDEGLRQVIRGFLDKHPGCAFQAVNGGGNYGGYDYTRYASSFSFSDGAVGILRNYYASLLFPPDKTSDIPDVWNPDKYDKATWRGLLCINFDMTGDTWDPAKLEGLRELIDIYHYLHTQGVVGRWVHVYRPVIEGDDATMYLQRLSRDKRRGILIPKRPAPGPITIKPKGLAPDEKYEVSFHESAAPETRTGADLMAKGIAIASMAPGELIYLNLPLHPGSKLDKTPPTRPRRITKHLGENMGYPGVELTWKPGKDNNWVSYYEISRNGVPIDKVAKGGFYFDHSAGADLAATYEVRTVDGAGNASSNTLANGPKCKPSRIVDDADGLTLSGKWEHKTGLLPAYAGTLSTSNEKGAHADLSFEGKKVLVFVKMGADCGKAAIRIDDLPPVTVDTYSADDIWGVCVFQKELSTAGPHTLRIEVIGVHSERAKDNFVNIDGVRVVTE
ncbi:MAG: hypothetical protein HZB26_01810 [Candidatus Hydrogenedentes bacterium]|nr:hypothetical protein [Candidatus Hydrogenedentota bacterium]